MLPLKGKRKLLYNPSFFLTTDEDLCVLRTFCLEVYKISFNIPR